MGRGHSDLLRLTILGATGIEVKPVVVFEYRQTTQRLIIPLALVANSDHWIV